ncbi:MAG: serine hydrolase [Gemmatimonadota bacterium]|nr:serine hydrolase [Gemmatimonadota bacterium]
MKSSLLCRIARVTPAFVLGILGPVEAQHFPDEAGLVEIIEARVDEGRATGIVVGVVEADGTRRVVAYGEAGPGARPLGPQSVFEIGSISKAFTGILLAEMAGRGEVRLEAPIQAYAHEGVTIPSRDGRDITFIDLATHRSSLPRLPANMTPADGSNPYADYTVDQMHEFLSGHSLTRDIGSQYEYSNLAVGLLGHLLAATADMEYEGLLRDRILGPLGMDMTGIELTPEMLEWLALGHAEGRPVSNWDLPTLAGAGAIRSNVGDMLTFLEANIGEPTSELEEAMRVSHQSLMEAGGGNDVALNWHILKLEDDRVIWHNGGTGGYRTFAGFDPEREVGVVVLTNSNEGADDIGFHLLNDRIPLAPAPQPTEERVEIDLDREIMARYVGVYELTPQFKITVTLEDDGLAVQATGQPQFRVFPESETKFFLRVVDAQTTFVIEDGEVVALILHQGGADQRARKVN